jgi:hypothetical protein
MHQNVVAFHAANGMLNTDPDLTQGGIGSFVLLAQLWSRVLFALAWLLGRDVNPITRVVRFNAKIAQINTNIDGVRLFWNSGGETGCGPYHGAIAGRLW